MVKIVSKADASRVATTKRVRGIKSKTNPTNIRKKKDSKAPKIKTIPFDFNYYLKPKIDSLLEAENQNLQLLKEQEDIEFMEYIDTNPCDVKNYNPEHRVKAIIGLKDMIYQIIELYKNQQRLKQDKSVREMKFPDNFELSVIALFERYLYKIGKDLNRNEIIKALFSCLIYIDKEQNIGVFNSSFFSKPNAPFELDLSVLSTVDLVIYPIKIYDYFDIFYLRISQQKKDDKQYQQYIIKFKKVFIEINFYLVFHENSKMKRPSTNFISCLYLTYNFIKNNDSLENNTVLWYINYYNNILNYDVQEYSTAKSIILESKNVYDAFVNELKVNKNCKEGLINGNNINCI